MESFTLAYLVLAIDDQACVHGTVGCGLPGGANPPLGGSDGGRV